MPLLLVLGNSLVVRLPDEDPARLAATAALVNLKPQPPNMANKPCTTGQRPRIPQ